MPSSLFALLDDIATVLDEVAILTKVAAKKTAGVLGDDLALNAQQISGVDADRELPVVWAVAKGSFRNKLILVPAALFLSVAAPWAIQPLLMIGGAYLCFEGFEKIAHSLLHSPAETEHRKIADSLRDPTVDFVVLEQEKIHGAIRTDFILSAEIIVIALGSAKDAALLPQFLVLSGIAVVMTIGVYGFVAAIVKIDDLGLYWQQSAQALLQRAGRALLRLAPLLMRTLSIVGTAAMFLVGGGILAHALPAVPHLPAGVLVDGMVGVLTGAAVFLTVAMLRKAASGLQRSADRGSR